MSDTPIDNGGPAFPSQQQFSNGSMGELSLGMTIRDWFAGQVMADAMSPAMIPHLDYLARIKEEAQRCAVRAYIMADAMLAARKEGTK